MTVLGSHLPPGLPGRLLRRLRRPVAFAFDPAETEGLDLVVGLAGRTEVHHIHITDTGGVGSLFEEGWNGWMLARGMGQRRSWR